MHPRKILNILISGKVILLQAEDTSTQRGLTAWVSAWKRKEHIMQVYHLNIFPGKPLNQDGNKLIL